MQGGHVVHAESVAAGVGPEPAQVVITVEVARIFSDGEDDQVVRFRETRTFGTDEPIAAIARYVGAFERGLVVSVTLTPDGDRWWRPRPRNGAMES